MRYTKNSSKNLEAQLIPSVAPHHLAPYHNHILSTVHHTNSVHQQNHSTHHHNHHHHHSSTVPPSPPSPKDKCKGMSNGSTTNGVTNNNNGEEVQADRPIGYGAFGVVWAVTDPRDGKRVALKKLPNVFSNVIAAKRVFRELKMLFHYRHENVLKSLDILQPPHNISLFQEIYLICELMQSDLHKIIVSPQPLSLDHVKVFLYQILRGLKYIHSSGVIHRDIKPGNLLVNSNCCLKICDFGLARKIDPNSRRNMTLEVVTQYYRAPELLMGATSYTSAIDTWSVGCIFAELLSRRILFQASSPVVQLDLIIDLLGTPPDTELKSACEPARRHVLSQPRKVPQLNSLYRLNSSAPPHAIHLLSQFLTWSPDKRISIQAALEHRFLDEGRLRYHTCMCQCCYNNSRDGSRVYCSDLDPICEVPFDASYEDHLRMRSIQDVKYMIHSYIMDHQQNNKVPLCINPSSSAYKSFANSTVAQPSELHSPAGW
ncbi:serine/threonine-protein kinase NLK2-like [Convolutriloba macropyga]|uniref:serine/threonine-protein kinase NLK2-like n=1 Tax=Convolutriloba macropyga TaxID=536237 RepID=UPI003F51C217